MERLGAFRVRTVLRNLRKEQQNKIAGSDAVRFWSERKARFWGECKPARPNCGGLYNCHEQGWFVEATPSRVFRDGVGTLPFKLVAARWRVAYWFVSPESPRDETT